MSYLAESSKVIEGKEVRLRMYHDEDINPRELFDNLGTMVCFHRNYDLGDSHNYGEVRDMLSDLGDDVSYRLESDLSEIAEKKFEDFFVVQDVDSDWYITDDHISEENYNGEYFETEEEALEELENMKDNFLDEEWKEELDDDELFELVEKHYVMLPLFLYDHSGITMNTSGFSCGWDSGAVGYIYVSHDDIKREYGKCDEESIKLATSVLRAEVVEYDRYLTGDIYWYLLEEKEVCEHCKNHEWNNVDSSGGYFGSDWYENGLTDNLDEKYYVLVDELKWQ